MTTDMRRRQIRTLTKSNQAGRHWQAGRLVGGACEHGGGGSVAARLSD